MSDDDKTELGDHKDIAVAKINARQAIIIALITTASGMIVAGFTGYMAALNTGSYMAATVQPQRWLTIKGITPTDQIPVGSAVRVVAIVNSQAFSFPSRALWTKLGPSMSSEKFPLPTESDQYQVRFEVFLNGSGNEPSVLTSQETQGVFTDSIAEPFVRDYRLFELDDQGMRGADPLLTINYEIR